jgi:hypothetical protein
VADTLDVITLAEAKAALDIASGDTGDDTELAMHITATSRYMDQLFGPIVRRTVTGEVVEGGLDRVWVAQWPVTSYTTVTEYRATVPTVLTAETATSQPNDSYWPEPSTSPTAAYSGRLFRRSAGHGLCFAPGGAALAVTYVAGRYANTAAVDARFKLCATFFMQNSWHSQEFSVGPTSGGGEYQFARQNFPRFGFPNVAADFLSSEMQSPGGFGLA